jgi:hypothetical protein
VHKSLTLFERHFRGRENVYLPLSVTASRSTYLNTSHLLKNSKEDALFLIAFGDPTGGFSPKGNPRPHVGDGALLSLLFPQPIKGPLRSREIK